jgi:tetratricopeptide (TPR) repeat protein
MVHNTLDLLVRAGRILEAIRFCREQPGTREAQICVTYTELLHLAGDLDEAERNARILEDEERLLTDSMRARCAIVIAAYQQEHGKYEVALDAIRRALRLAESAQDDAVSAIAAAQLLERSARGDWRECVALASRTRRYTVCAGDPQVTARVNLSMGRLEGRIGNFDIATRHFDLARKILEKDQNTWIDAAIDLDEASVLGLRGDYDAAVQLALRGAASASTAGWAKGQALAAANLGFFYVMLGQETEALRWIKTAPHQFRQQPAYRLAIAETLAQAEYAKQRFEQANDLLDCSEFGRPSNLSWYDLSCHVTRSRIMLARGDYASAQACAEAGLSLARESQNKNTAAALAYCRVEALAGQGTSVNADDIWFAVDDDATGELLASAYIARGKALSAVGAQSAGAQNVARGGRILLATGSAPSRIRAGLLGMDDQSGGKAAPSLDSAVALLELAGHPHILGPEAFALIQGAACADAVALIAASPAGTRIVQRAGWSESQASAAAAVASDGTEHLPIGRRAEETWTLVVLPKREIEPYCTFASIRKLLTVALSLDGYRRDEKQRAALWPAEALDSDPECIWASEQMSETLTIARRIAPTPLSVLVTGETGTGKEMLARTIHRASDRADKVFLPFNCTAVPRDMLESQLFGYRKGAFTGADASFPGVIRSAAGGTLFLDEIGEIGPEIQP